MSDGISVSSTLNLDSMKGSYFVPLERPNAWPADFQLFIQHQEVIVSLTCRYLSIPSRQLVDALSVVIR